MWVNEFGNTDEASKFGFNVGSRSHKIFIDAFRNIKTLKYSDVIVLFGLDNVGSKFADQVALMYNDLEPDWKGHEKALIEMFKEEYWYEEVEERVKQLENIGIIIERPKIKVMEAADDELIYACLTGSPKSAGYATKEIFLGEFTQIHEVSITDKKCNLLLTDSYDSTSSKMKNATKKGIDIMTYEDWNAL